MIYSFYYTIKSIQFNYCSQKKILINLIIPFWNKKKTQENQFQKDQKQTNKKNVSRQHKNNKKKSYTLLLKIGDHWFKSNFLITPESKSRIKKKDTNFPELNVIGPHSLDYTINNSKM